MKKLFLFIGVIFALNVSAQSQYEKGKEKVNSLKSSPAQKKVELLEEKDVIEEEK